MKRIFLFLTVALALLALYETGQAQGVAPVSHTVIVNVQEQPPDTPAPSTFFVAALDGAQEVPAVTTTARGTGGFQLVRGDLRYLIMMDGLSGPMTGAHFHNGAPGVAGPVVQPIQFKGNTAEGAWAISPAMVAELLAGRIYVNIHTANNPGGEIRGQVTVAPGLGSLGHLEGRFENPPVTTEAEGTGAFWLDGNGLNYRIMFSRLSGPLTGSHFHNAPSGVNGPVVRAIAFDGNTASGTWRFDDATQPLTPELLRGLLTRRIYVNLHTAANPGGEIRAQIAFEVSLRMTAALDGGQENPPVTTTAMGTGWFELGGPAGDLRYWITYSGLSGPLTGSHFHNAAVGTNGPVVQPIRFDGTTTSGTWAISPEMVKELLAGRIYVNLHTAANPGGEIRGQLTSASGVFFAAALTGRQENPPVTTPAAGTGFVIWDGSGLTYRKTVDGLSGAITAAHFHSALPGTNGPVVRPTPFTGSTASGTVSAADAAPLLADLWGEKLYFNVHTAANPGGEIRGQVVRPRPFVARGQEIAFSRAVSGRAPDYAWKGILDENGKATIRITVPDDPAFRRVGANGYYRARLTPPSPPGGPPPGGPPGILPVFPDFPQWTSIPLRGGRAIDLLLVPGRPAVIVGPFYGTPIQSAGKPVAGPPTLTVLSGAEPMGAAVSFGAAESKTDGALDMPVQISGVSNLFGGDLVLTYDPALLTFRGGRIGTADATVTQSEPGQVVLSFDRLTAADRNSLLLSFERRSGDRLGNLKLTGLLFDQDLMPIAEVETEARLNGDAPARYALSQNYPNPFNPTTQIRYALPEGGRVRLTVYNVLGQEVARLVDVRQEAGVYTVTWDAREMASGIYYYRLESGAFREVKRLMLLK